MGSFYITGICVKRDLGKAEKYFFEAMRLGYRRAKANLKVLKSMEEGDEVEVKTLPERKMLRSCS